MVPLPGMGVPMLVFGPPQVPLMLFSTRLRIAIRAFLPRLG